MKMEILNGLHIAGISTSVENNITNQSQIINLQKKKLEKKKFKNSSNIIGVKKNYFTSQKTTTVDLCFDSAKRLLKKLKWKNHDIDILVFVTQTPDFLMPSCSSIIHNKLNLKKIVYLLISILVVQDTFMVYGISIKSCKMVIIKKVYY